MIYCGVMADLCQRYRSQRESFGYNESTKLIPKRRESIIESFHSSKLAQIAMSPQSYIPIHSTATNGEHQHDKTTGGREGITGNSTSRAAQEGIRRYSGRESEKIDIRPEQQRNKKGGRASCQARQVLLTTRVPKRAGIRARRTTGNRRRRRYRHRHRHRRWSSR